jgi:two-component system response regulator FlrC
VLADGPTITPEHLLFDETDPAPPSSLEGVPQISASPAGVPAERAAASCDVLTPVGMAADGGLSSTLPAAVRDNEVRIVRAALAANSTRDEAARQLGISPRTLRHKLAQWRQQGLLTA